MNSNNRIAATSRDIVCLRNMSINTLHEGDDDDDDDNNNNNNTSSTLYKVSQKSLDTACLLLNIECHMTFAPFCAHNLSY